MDPEATNAELHFRRGMEAARRGDWPTAEQAWKSALDLNSCWSAAWNNIANVQRRRASWAEVEACLLREVAFAPDDPELAWHGVSSLFMPPHLGRAAASFFALALLGMSVLKNACDCTISFMTHHHTCLRWWSLKQLA